MAGRGRTALTSRKGGSSVAAVVPRRAPLASRPLVYTAQDLARFCEVDLKTIHHWADGGKIPHHRTEGRHLRFRRNHVLAFLRRHGYPLHAELANARPTVFFAMPTGARDGSDDRDGSDAAPPPHDDVAKKLSARFFVRRFESALSAIAHLVAGEPDVLVVGLEDPTWTGARAIRELKSRPDTSWTTLAVVTRSGLDGEAREAREAREAGADLVIPSGDVIRLNGELVRALAVE